MNLTVSIPIYLSDPLHADFTRQTIDSITTKHSYQIQVVVNHTSDKFAPFLKQLQELPHLTLTKNPKGNQLAAAWNLGLKQGIQNKSDYILIINNDILFHPKAIDNLVLFAQDRPEYLLWTGCEWPDMRTLSQATWDNSFDQHPHFSCFMITTRTVDTVGYFDENLQGAYFEDNDYHTRLLLSGHKAAKTTTARFYHYGSRTANIDDRLRAINKANYQKNRKYLEKKWGLDFHGQGFHPPEAILKKVYSHPFNKPQNTLKDW